MTSDYPSGSPAQTAWIVSKRPNLDAIRSGFSTARPADRLIEMEPGVGGIQLRTLTVFLRNRECPWHCLMCDLWQQTTLATVPDGAIPEQLDWAFRQSRKPGV